MLSLAQRLAARISELDDWDDGGDLVLDHEAGGRILSYTGTHGWNAGAGHEPPTSEPALRVVCSEIETAFDSLPPERSAALRAEFEARQRTFDRAPTMANLIDLASVVDRVAALYPSLGSRAYPQIAENRWPDEDE